jgi:hypothetical protein
MLRNTGNVGQKILLNIQNIELHAEREKLIAHIQGIQFTIRIWINPTHRGHGFSIFYRCLENIIIYVRNPETASLFLIFP